MSEHVKGGTTSGKKRKNMVLDDGIKGTEKGNGQSEHIGSGTRASTRAPVVKWERTETSRGKVPAGLAEEKSANLGSSKGKNIPALRVPSQATAR